MEFEILCQQVAEERKQRGLLFRKIFSFIHLFI
jgi:hypothetical protein